MRYYLVARSFAGPLQMDGELDGFEEAMEAMAFDNMCRPRAERNPFMRDTLDMMGITSEDDEDED